VTPPLFLVEDLGTGSSLVLTGAEAHHAGTVKRLVAGEAVWLADGRGGLAEATVAAVSRDRVVCTVTARRAVPEREPRFTVAQALPKGERADLAVEALTELGVDEILPWAAERAITQWRAERAERGRTRWQRTAREASKQCRRARVPVIGPLYETANLVDRSATAALTLVLHEDAPLPLAGTELPARGEVLLVVGPEGGLSPAELTRLAAAGARAVRLGPEVMRTATAGAAALAVLNVRAGRWR